jgi:protein-S-isoprenylcysteine O-methyltransferase Ste14
MVGKRALTATLLTVGSITAYIVDSLRQNLGTAALFVILPFLLSSLAAAATLVASLTSKPIRVDERWGMLLIAFASSNAGVVLHFVGIDLVNPNRQMAMSIAAQVMSLSLVPFYVLAVLTLGRQMSVAPEARRVITRGPYSVSRHPLYVTYVTQHLLGIGVAQSIAASAISVAAAALFLVRAVAEEALLLQVFPVDYAEYCRRVGWIGRWSPRFAMRAPRTVIDLPCDDTQRRPADTYGDSSRP